MDEIVGAPSYTRPAKYENLEVPEALLSGNHGRINEYRRRTAIEKCLQNRPDLLKQAELTEDEKKLVRQLNKNIDID